jgi:hypothetical protein
MGEKHLCEACRGRKARFQYRGVVKADRAHTLCFACFRSERDRLRARSLAASAAEGMVAGEQDHRAVSVAANAGMPNAGPMTPAQRAHRFRMLAHMTRARAQRSS